MVVLRLLKFSQKKFSYPLIGVLTENVLEKTHARGKAYIDYYTGMAQLVIHQKTVMINATFVWIFVTKPSKSFCDAILI